MYSASQMMACPMETSAVQGIVLMKYSRFTRFRSWPVLMSRPQSSPSRQWQIRPDRPFPCLLHTATHKPRIKVPLTSWRRRQHLGHGRIRVNENRRSDAGVSEFAADVPVRKSLVFQCVPACIRGYRIFGVRHQRHLRRPPPPLPRSMNLGIGFPSMLN